MNLRMSSSVDHAVGYEIGADVGGQSLPFLPGIALLRVRPEHNPNSQSCLGAFQSADQKASMLEGVPIEEPDHDGVYRS
jgi:hypothetical protein